MAAAAMPFLGDWRAARELSNNAAVGLVFSDVDTAAVCRQAIEHRVKHFGLRCGDVALCSACMARAWHRSRAEILELAS